MDGIEGRHAEAIIRNAEQDQRADPRVAINSSLALSPWVHQKVGAKVQSEFVETSNPFLKGTGQLQTSLPVPPFILPEL